MFPSYCRIGLKTRHKLATFGWQNKCLIPKTNRDLDWRISLGSTKQAAQPGMDGNFPKWCENSLSPVWKFFVFAPILLQYKETFHLLKFFGTVCVMIILKFKNTILWTGWLHCIHTLLHSESWCTSMLSMRTWFGFYLNPSGFQPRTLLLACILDSLALKWAKNGPTKRTIPVPQRKLLR